MAVTQRLELRQSQTLVMTPQLQQAIKLLQLSNLELATFVDRELEQNPLLELEGGGATEGRDEERSGPEPAATEAESPRDSMDYASAESLPSSSDDPLDTSAGDLYVDAGPGDLESGQESYLPAARGGEDEGLSAGERLASAPTLREHLLDQVQMDISDPRERMIAWGLVDMLDEAGYLAADLAVLAELLGCPEDLVETVLRKVQRFDPAGLFARSLKECLALQLADRNRLDPAIQALLDNLDLLARGKLQQLRRICGVSEEDMHDMIAEVRSLNPKPATAFGDLVVEPVVPDITMRRARDGGWLLELNSETLPRVLVNMRYYSELSSHVQRKEDQEYLSERLSSANWLVKALHQRATTILKVASEIVERQKAFFDKGVQYMKPLTLRQVAEGIGMHESTVSRVTTNKYVATPRGVFELKYFFTAAISGGDGAALSAVAVQHRIRGLIDNESSDSILSDDMIVAALRKENIAIARRTVAKYREFMRIPSSAERRRLKSSNL